MYMYTNMNISDIHTLKHGLFTFTMTSKLTCNNSNVNMIIHVHVLLLIAKAMD